MRDRVFDGAIPEMYERVLVPLIFAPYAVDLARRVRSLAPERLLEVAAGTGVATREIAAALPNAHIVATDINEPMLRVAAAKTEAPNVEWRQADALELPFDDASFDVVVCEFGAMFFPDKAKGYAEARRVLREGGHFVFSVWDRIEENEFADVVVDAVSEMLPDAPPRFLARTPHGHYDLDTIARDLAAAGFTAAPQFDTLAERSRASSPRIPAVAYVEGTPMRNEIPESRVAEATDVATEALARRFGSGEVDGKIQAHVVTITR